MFRSFDSHAKPTVFRGATRFPRFGRRLVFLLFVQLAAGLGFAQSGTWTSTSNGTWSTTSNWSGGTVANGSGNNADFSSIDVPDLFGGYLGVQLDSARTIGSLTFGDTNTSTTGYWLLGNNGSASNILTLAGTTPTITVSTGRTRIDAVLAGVDGLTKAGSGRLDLNAANTYTGGTTISAGEVLLMNLSGLGTGAVSVAASAQLTFNVSGSFANDLTLAGSSRLAATPGGSNIATATGSVVLNGTVTLIVLNTSTLEFSGVVSGSGGFTRSSGNAGTIIKFSGSSANTYTGMTTINAGIFALNKAAGVTAIAGDITIGASGTLRLDAINQIADTSALSVSGTFNLNGQTESVGSLSGAGSVSLGAGSLAVGGANTSTTFSGVMSGSGALSKYGSGTFTLSGANTHAGGTTISDGTLTLGSATTLSGATGMLTVNGGTLASSVASTTLGGDLSLSSGAISPNSTSAGTLTLAAGKAFSMSGGTLNLTLGSSFDQIASAGSGTLSLTGGTINFDTTGAGFSYASTYQIFSGFSSTSFSSLTLSGYDAANYTAAISGGGVLSFSAVPEPSTYAAIFGTAALGFATWRRRRRAGSARQSSGSPPRWRA